MRKSLVLLLLLALTLGFTLPVAADNDGPPPPPDLPTSVITLPIDGAILTTLPILIKGTATDQDGISKVELDIQGAVATATVLATITATRQGGVDWQYSWNPTQTGTYTLVSKATDLFNLVQEPSTLKPILVTFNPQGSPSPTPTPSSTVTPSPPPTVPPTPGPTPTPNPTVTPSTVFFSDLNGHWASSLIVSLTSRGILSGYPDGSFRPDQPITRAEFCTILGRSLSLAPSASGELFTDISTHWAKGYIMALVEKGTVKGYPDGTFRPDQLIKRDEIAAIIARAKSLPALTDKATFSDVNAGQWAFGVIEACASAGILSGYPDGTFRPEIEATRAEACAVISRSLGF